MDTPCYVNCPTLTTQTITSQNKCKVEPKVKEDIDDCKPHLLASLRIGTCDGCHCRICMTNDRLQG